MYLFYWICAFKYILTSLQWSFNIKYLLSVIPMWSGNVTSLHCVWDVSKNSSVTWGFFILWWLNSKEKFNVICCFKLRKEELDKRRRQEEEEKLQKMKAERREMVRLTICTLTFQRKHCQVCSTWFKNASNHLPPFLFTFQLLKKIV